MPPSFASGPFVKISFLEEKTDGTASVFKCKRCPLIFLKSE